VLNAACYGCAAGSSAAVLAGRAQGLPAARVIPKAPIVRPPPGAPGRATSSADTPTVWDAFRDLPEADDFDELLERDCVRAHFKTPSDYAAPVAGPRARSRGPFHSARTRPQAPHFGVCAPSTRSCQTALRRDAPWRDGAGQPVPPSSIRRAFATRFRAGTASDRGAFTSPRPIHPFRLAASRFARPPVLHSYPDWFRFHVTKWHGFRQIGNSVPPLLARAVREEDRGSSRERTGQAGAHARTGRPCVARSRYVESRRQVRRSGRCDSETYSLGAGGSQRMSDVRSGKRRGKKLNRYAAIIKTIFDRH